MSRRSINSGKMVLILTPRLGTSVKMTNKLLKTWGVENEFWEDAVEEEKVSEIVNDDHEYIRSDKCVKSI